MNYLDALEAELAVAGIPRRRPRLARAAALRAFGGLAFAAVAIAAMILVEGRLRGITLSSRNHTSTPGWAAALTVVCFLAGEVALAAGGTGFLRAWWLRTSPVISSAEATVLVRRVAVAVPAGMVTLLLLPTLALAYPHQVSATWSISAWLITGLGLIGLATVLPSLRHAIALRPSVRGPAGGPTLAPGRPLD